MNEDSLATRSRRLLREARYLSLGTVSGEGRPWVAALEYAWLTDPLRFVFGSATESQHGRDIAVSPEVGGSLFVTGDATGGAFDAIDGAQFAGRCTEVSADDLAQFHSAFYEAVFPNAQQRAEWMLPRSLLQSPAEHRLYLIEVDRWWLIDTRTWAQDRIDRRVEMPLNEMRPSRALHRESPI